MYKRVVLKLSGEALAGNTDKNFDNETIFGIIDQIKEVISGKIRRITLPSLLGLIPISDILIAFSISFKIVESKGEIAIILASGVETLATWLIGTSAP